MKIFWGTLITVLVIVFSVNLSSDPQKTRHKSQVNLIDIGFIPAAHKKSYKNIIVQRTHLNRTNDITLMRKPSIIHFWAPWCGPCRSELPGFSKFVQNHPDAQIWCVADSEQTPQTIQAFYQSKKLNKLPIMIDVSHISHRMGANALPTTIFLDADGYEIGRIVGPVDWDNPDVENLIYTKLLK